MNKDQPIIRIQNLKKSYDGENYVLCGIDVDIFPGQIIGYIGPNGAGKTTTIKILIGMLPDFEGQVTVFGNDVSENPLEVKKRIGYVPETAALYDTLTPLEYLRFVGQIYGISKETILSRTKKMLTLFGLKDHLNVRMNSFSKGMKQKVLVTAGLIHDPDILFLDEPLAGLDANTSMIIKEILSLLAAEGKTIFYCSHVMDVVERICHRIIIIDKGTIIANGSFDELQEMNKGKSLEGIFSKLTGSSGHAAKAREFISAFHSETEK
ncbi:MAG: ABC transporter ATP-binding protein [Candidatus Aminicenantaceae bacterium]